MVSRRSTAATTRTRMKHLKPPLATTQPFKWKAQQWAKQKDIAFGVSIMYNKLNHKLLVVKKVVRIPDHSEKLRALEARALSLLPDCNRITKPLLDLIMEPDMDHATIFFEHFPLGDLKQWKTRKFDERNNKPVPESFIWRCFIQMSQAVAFIHNSVGSEPDANRHCLLHRDIKPNNILVVDNGTTYPSFQLHDFGCARLYQETLAGEPMYCGTYKWQPPENPFINTTEADIWALGACVHFLAVGRPPVQDLAGFTAQFKDNLHVEDFVRPGSLTEYASVGRYCGAHVPRKVTPINLSPEEQQERGIDPEIHQYSDNLADWMSLCLRFTPSERPSARRLLEEMVDDGKEILRSMGGQAALAHLELIVDDKAWG